MVHLNCKKYPLNEEPFDSEKIKQKHHQNIVHFISQNLRLCLNFNNCSSVHHPMSIYNSQLNKTSSMYFQYVALEQDCPTRCREGHGMISFVRIFEKHETV